MASLWQYAQAKGIKLYVTGSTLTACLLPSTARHAPPSDLDVFVESAGSLTDCLAELRAAVALCQGETHTCSQTAHKYRLRLQFPSYEVEVDLYWHALAKLHAYHISAARVAFDGSRLYCAPSAVVALATTVNACFDMRWKPERGLSILLNPPSEYYWTQKNARSSRQQM